MAKKKTPGSGKSIGTTTKERGKVKSPKGSTWTKRDVESGTFVLGRSAFATISAAEGVHLSKQMNADLHRLDGASASERRRVLAGKYGRK